MLILTCPAQLQRLEGALRRSLPLALPVHGAVMNINRGNPGEFEVVVDSWPDFGAVLARPCWGQKEGGSGAGMGVLGSRCPPPPLTAPSPGLQEEVAKVSQAILDAGVAPADGQPSPPSHVDLLNETWPYGGNSRSRRYLAELLRCFPNLCLQDGAGQPLSWCLTDHFGTGAHGYTLPAHRRRGHMQAVMVLAARRKPQANLLVAPAVSHSPSGQCHYGWGWGQADTAPVGHWLCFPVGGTHNSQRAVRD
uniref:Glycine N-acyltransferase-like protein n=1 Tax=Strix occidentalis caurina TaxID=311401 RepID=A0A8D0F8I3_STROC